MNILVTGGAGFIGSHIVDALIDLGHKVIIVDNFSTGSLKNVNPKAKLVERDIVEPLADIFHDEKIDVVYHLAAQINVRKSVEDAVIDAKINVMGGLNILECCRKFKIKKFIFASTGGAMYGDTENIPTPEEEKEMPVSPYGIAKCSMEKYLYYYYKVHKMPYVALRFSNVYGPRQNSKGEAGVVAIFTAMMLAGKQPVINGDGKQTRDYVYVKDVVKANILALNKNVAGIYNVGTGVETDVNELFQKLNKLIGTNFKEVHKESMQGEQIRSCLDASKIKKELGWKPDYDLDEGLKETVDWFRKK